MEKDQPRRRFASSWTQKLERSHVRCSWMAFCSGCQHWSWATQRSWARHQIAEIYGRKLSSQVGPSRKTHLYRAHGKWLTTLFFPERKDTAPAKKPKKKGKQWTEPTASLFFISYFRVNITSRDWPKMSQQPSWSTIISAVQSLCTAPSCPSVRSVLEQMTRSLTRRRLFSTAPEWAFTVRSQKLANGTICAKG